MIDKLHLLPPTFTSGDARAAGVHPRDLYGWREDGRVDELSRGVFRRSDAPLATFPDFLAVSRRAPRAIICCVTAAAAWELSDEMVSGVQIAVASTDRPPRITYPPTTVFRFDASAFEIGLTTIESAPGESVRIYEPARTVIDLMRLRHRLGETTAHIALQRYLRRRDAKPARLLELSRLLDVYGPVRIALDIATAA